MDAGGSGESVKHEPGTLVPPLELTSSPDQTTPHRSAPSTDHSARDSTPERACVGINRHERERTLTGSESRLVWAIELVRRFRRTELGRSGVLLSSGQVDRVDGRESE